MNGLTFPSIRTEGLTAILGLGETGLAAAQWCLDNGAPLRVLDTRDQPAGLDAWLATVSAPVEQRLGAAALHADSLDGVHTLVLSPGLSPLEPALAQFLSLAQEQGVEVIGEIELFARALNDLRAQGHQSQLVAITGTNGKTTVTSLLVHLLNAAGIQAKAAGNIAPAALAALRSAILAEQLPQVWVLELSSFQLASTDSLVCDAAAVLNISQDHLDWHGSMQAYIQAKARLFGMSRIQVFNRDDPQVLSMLAEPDGVSARGFSTQAPQRVGDMGLGLEGGMEWLLACEASEVDQVVVGKRRAQDTDTTSLRPEGRVNKLMPQEALQIQGRHNALNALAALSLARSLGLAWPELLHALRSYHGEPHRLELVRVMQGVSYFDDSKGTNVGATVAALNGLDQPVVLIAGGLGKGQDFSPLACAVQRIVKKVFLIGQDAQLIAQALSATGVTVDVCTDMEQAVGLAVDYAQPGDAVLLSPACASMDMFRNYQHRGECFVSALTELALDRGEAA